MVYSVGQDPHVMRNPMATYPGLLPLIEDEPEPLPELSTSDIALIRTNLDRLGECVELVAV